MGSSAQAQARLGRYELLARLATGGMGEIFLARLEGAAGFEKLYVVKRILPHLADDLRFRQMLIGEARIAAQMSHANICQVYELGETDGQLYIVMEYLEGVTLLPLLRRASKLNAPLELGFIAGVIQQVTDALHYAHELKDRDGVFMGIIHRDVSPGNIFLTESGVAKVLDFGIAKAKGASAKTEDGAVKGKYAYMAPEQLRGAEIDRRVDVFAVGVVLYETVALRRLFQRKTDYLTFRAVMEQPIGDVRRYRGDAPEALAAVLSRALDRDPAARFDSVRQLGAALADAIAPISRAWTQGEISDFVRAHFAESISKRSTQVASALQRTQVGVASQRATMPLLSQFDDEPTVHDDADDELFPPVETDVAAPTFTVPASRPSDFIEGTPPPFAGEPTGSAPSLQLLRSTQSSPQLLSPTQPNVVVVSQRSVVWPLVAIAGVAVAGGALYLVWQQTQQRQAPAVVNITSGPAEPRPTPTELAQATPPQPPAGSQVGSDPTGSDAPATVPTKVHKVRRPNDPAKPYDDVLALKQPRMQACFQQHRDTAIPASGLTVSVTISPAGRAEQVTIRPDDLNSGPLAECVRGVLLGGGFPKAKDVQVVTVSLTPHTT